MGKYLVRKGKPEDAYWICFVNVHTRYTTYKWLIPEIVLKARIDSIDERTEHVRESIISGKNYLVVENTETSEIIWMSIYWPSINEKYPNSGKIYALYILKDYQKLGIGKKLFFKWIEELIKLWFDSMIINVLEWNDTINFYKKYGGKIIWEKYEQFGEKELKEYVLLFNDLKSIISQ